MEEQTGFKKFLSFKTILTLLIILTFINLLFLNLTVFGNKKTPQILEKIIPSMTVDTKSVDNPCSPTCLSQVNEIVKEATRSYKPAITITIAPVATSTPKPTPQTQSSNFSVKEFFIPFGSGVNSSDDWEDVGGLKASIDSENYGDVKTITFEASIRIPTGNQTAYVRLYNATDKHPVWSSDVSLDGGTPALLVSKPITLDNGNKTYQVQMKTSLKYSAILDQARLHIVTY